MTAHKFATGDRVMLLPDRLNQNVRPGIYTVVRPLPFTTGQNQYRVKNTLDSHERVMDEAQLLPT